MISAVIYKALLVDPEDTHERSTNLSRLKVPNNRTLWIV